MGENKINSDLPLILANRLAFVHNLIKFEDFTNALEELDGIKKEAVKNKLSEIINKCDSYLHKCKEKTKELVGD
ncbi:MAG: hypothetical protein BAJALOKI2v1_450006 [Promethearchaeota archaeon]|nr:MAG: hypothetical protein BAJALOKI2v1_450006 [Candidatus Lokiarchaeota archaeon]